MTRKILVSVTMLVASLSASGAFAQEGMRFRGGIAAVAGIESISGATATMFGADGRLGLQIDDLIGVYVQPHLSFGSFGLNGFVGGGLTGTFAATAMVDFTLFDRLFGGGGVGFGVLNNPSGPVIHLRLGGYPLMGRADSGGRRKGLMVGADFRTYFTSAGTAVQFTGSIGYEAF